MVLLLVSLTVLGLGYAVAGSAGAATADTTTTPGTITTQIEAGRKLFLEGCSSCHGLGAQGTYNAPTLIGVGAAAADFQLSTGRMPLAAPGAQAPQKAVQYNDQEIAAMSAFIGSLSPGPRIPSAEDLDTAGADVVDGGELFRTNCSQCHNFAGKGGGLSDGSYAPTLTDATPQQIYEAMITGPENMPVFGNETLTPENKKQIIAYIQNLEKEPNVGGWALGDVGPVSEGVFVFIGGMAALVGIAVWIGAKVR